MSLTPPWLGSNRDGVTLSTAQGTNQGGTKGSE